MYASMFLSAVLLAGPPFQQVQTAPSTYRAYTGVDTKIIPPAPALGPANSVLRDPTFGSRILRVTDPNTKAGQSFISTDSGFSRTWNADSSAIKLTGPRGDGYWLEFSPIRFSVGDGLARPAIHPLTFGARWQWSTLDPDIIYFLNYNQIAKYSKLSNTVTNLGGPTSGEPVAYDAAVIGFDNWVCAAVGSGPQDSYKKIFCLNPSVPQVTKLVDIDNKTVNGIPQSDPNWPAPASGQSLGIHGISGGTGPSWLEVTFHGQSWGGNGGAVLDLATNTWSLVTNADPYWSGHVSMGNGKYANSSGSINGRDSRGMVVRDPDRLMDSKRYQFIEQPPDTLNHWCDADHSSWLNSAANPNSPILISRYGPVGNCQYAWTGEIDAAAVDGSNTVWRFAHNHNQGGTCYYGQAFAQISNDGKWALFSSPWDGTLGADTTFGCTTRIDTFIVELAPDTRSPAVNFTYSPSLPLTGDLVSFDGASSTCPATPCSYRWTDDADGSLLGVGSTMSVIFKNVGAQYVRLTVTDARAQAASVEHDVLVTSHFAPPPLPEAVFVSSPSNPSTGSPVLFDGSLSTCSATPCTYRWTDDADGSLLGAGAKMSVTFKRAGVKHVRLTVMDARSKTASVEHDVVVKKK